MKNLLLIAFALSIFSTAYAQNTYVAGLIGTWKLSNMICADGQPPSIPFTPGTDSLNLKYDGAQFVLEATLSGTQRTITGSYSVTQDQISMVESTTGQSRTFGYMLPTATDLTIIESEAACNQGQNLLLNFVK